MYNKSCIDDRYFIIFKFSSNIVLSMHYSQNQISINDKNSDNICYLQIDWNKKYDGDGNHYLTTINEW